MLDRQAVMHKLWRTRLRTLTLKTRGASVREKYRKPASSVTKLTIEFCSLCATVIMILSADVIFLICLKDINLATSETSVIYKCDARLPNQSIRLKDVTARS
jgi:hypothetical protein